MRLAAMQLYRIGDIEDAPPHPRSRWSSWRVAQPADEPSSSGHRRCRGVGFGFQRVVENQPASSTATPLTDDMREFMCQHALPSIREHVRAMPLLAEHDSLRDRERYGSNQQSLDEMSQPDRRSRPRPVSA